MSKRTTPGASRRRVSKRVIGAVAVIGTATSLTGVAVAAGSFGHDKVGQDGGKGVLLPTQQRVTPVGTRYRVDSGRLLSSTLSPDGTKLAALTWNNFTGFLSIIDVRSGKVLRQVTLGTSSPPTPTLGDGTVAADGPLYSSDGKSLWVSQSKDMVRFAVSPDGAGVTGRTVIPLVGDGPGGIPDLPSGAALSPDGSSLYVALNGANALGVIDTATNTLVKKIPVGNAPRQVVLVGSKAFVSNEGGWPAQTGDTTNLSYNTPIVSNPSTGAATTGTVSVVDLTGAAQTAAVPVGLQPTAEYLSGDGTLFVANSNDDSVSLINPLTEKVIQTVNVNPLPGSTVGSYPNAITMPDAHTVLVSIGRDNAIAEYHYNGALQPLSYEGLIPTDFYPVNVAFDKRLGQVVVTNDKGIGARGPASTITEGQISHPATGHNTYDDTGSLTVFGPQTQAGLAADTHQVFVDNTWDQLLAREQSQTPSNSVVAVPTRPGQTSPIKHVFLIVKENRTYDQVLGDIGKGDSDPSLTQFGASVTPNQHVLANTFGLYDNFYDEGTLSADGHNWLVQADANDYIEKEFGAFYRSYPAQGGDALAYQRDGFIWNAAAKAGLTSKAFGEYNNFFNLPATPPTWLQWYHDSQILQGRATGPLDTPIGKYATYSDIPSLNKITDMAYPRFNLDVPDQYRTDIWERSFAQSQKTSNLANLNLMWVPDDHTSGNTGADPAPAAEVADNDLAVGRIVDSISHSKFWASSAIFVVEDDPQNGVDHVDGHRSTLQVISPYAKRSIVDSTYYTQLNVVRTIENILGIAPMNQEDRAAVPMVDAFTNAPDLTAYNKVPNQIPLTYGVTIPPGTTSGTQSDVPARGAGGGASASDIAGSGGLALHSSSAPTAAPASVPAAQAGTYQAWQLWAAQQHFGGATPIQDFANPRQLNRYDFYSVSGWTKPYPGDTAILTPDQVPGATMPSDYLGD